MSDLDFLADAEAQAAAPEVDNNQLERIADLAAQQVTLEERIAKGEAYLKKLSEEHKELSERTLPNAMSEVGMSEFKLENGTKITIKNMVFASIPKDNPGPAFQWLRDTGNDGLIKNEISVQFGKGEDEDALKVAQAIAELGHRPDQKQTVHPSTLKAFVGEQMRNGVNIPLEAFGAYTFDKAKVELPKVKK